MLPTSLFSDFFAEVQTMIISLTGLAKKGLSAEAQMSFTPNFNLKKMYEVNQWTKCCLQQNQVATPAVWFLLYSSHSAKHGKTSAPTQLPLKTTTRDLPYLKPTQTISGDFFFFFQSITRQSFSLFLENGSVHMLSNLCKHNWAHCFVFETSNIISSDAHRGLSASRKLITTEE